MSSESEQVGYPEAGGPHTGGHSGSETSRQQAVREALDGTKAQREKDVLRALSRLRVRGITVKELRETTEWHHGKASSVLSTLHKAGKIARLTERRDRCAVYVANDYINGRQIEPFGRTDRRIEEAFKAGYLIAVGDEEETPDWLLQHTYDLWRQAQ